MSVSLSSAKRMTENTSYILFFSTECVILGIQGAACCSLTAHNAQLTGGEGGVEGWRGERLYTNREGPAGGRCQVPSSLRTDNIKPHYTKTTSDLRLTKPATTSS